MFMFLYKSAGLRILFYCLIINSAVFKVFFYLGHQLWCL
jgi:hypothetical protein